MKRLIPVIIESGVIGIIVGTVIMLIAFPSIFPPAEVNEIFPLAEITKRVGSGKFVTVDENAPFHQGQGNVSVYQRDEKIYVYLEKTLKLGQVQICT